MNTFNLQVVSLDNQFYDGPCEALTIPAVDGEQGVLANHEPMVMAIKAGEMRYTINGQEQAAAVGCGFAEITGDKVVVITDFAMKPEDIDVERAERAKAKAEEALREKESQVEFARSQAKLARAMARLKVAKKHNRTSYNQH